jgi:transcriptional regulator with XRE-family HTH domain
MTLGERIKSARKKAGLSQKDLANRMGVTQSNISQYENGYKSPGYETLERFASAIGCGISDLLPGEVTASQGDSSAGSSLLLQSDEYDLLCSYRALNASGKNKVIAYAEDLSHIAKYIRSDPGE